LGEGVDLLGKLAGDVAVAEVLAHHRAILALGQGVVIGEPGAELGQLRAHLLRRGDDPAIRPLMYSDALSLWKPRMTKWKASRSA
jgi:hypothetical protein